MTTIDQKSATLQKIAFVTGASSGIGRAITKRLAADGHHVIAAARRTDLLDELAETDGVEACALDVTDLEAVRDAVTATVARHGRLDVFVANAGVMPLSRLDAGLVDQWNHMIDVNVRGLLHGIAAVSGPFAEQGSGHFVTIASIGAHGVTPTAAVYCGTKYAAWAITEGLRLESPPAFASPPSRRVSWSPNSRTPSPIPLRNRPCRSTGVMPSRRRRSPTPSRSRSRSRPRSTSTRSWCVPRVSAERAAQDYSSGMVSER